MGEITAITEATGGGGKKLTESDPELMSQLKTLVDPTKQVAKVIEGRQHKDRDAQFD